MRLKAPLFIMAAALSRERGANLLGAKPATLDKKYLLLRTLLKASCPKTCRTIFDFQPVPLEETVGLCSFVQHSRGFSSSGI